MPSFSVIGTQWGDEGKGKVTDYYASGAEIVARFQGGNNAGHTLVVGGETFKFHLLPSGIIRPNILNVIGNEINVTVTEQAGTPIKNLETENFQVQGHNITDVSFFHDQNYTLIYTISCETAPPPDVTIEVWDTRGIFVTAKKT